MKLGKNFNSTFSIVTEPLRCLTANTEPGACFALAAGCMFAAGAGNTSRRRGIKKALALEKFSTNALRESGTSRCDFEVANLLIQASGYFGDAPSSLGAPPASRLVVAAAQQDL